LTLHYLSSSRNLDVCGWESEKETWKNHAALAAWPFSHRDQMQCFHWKEKYLFIIPEQILSHFLKICVGA